MSSSANFFVKKTFSVARLDQFTSSTPGRYLPLSDEALRLAAELWAKARQQGRPTADLKDLDVDVILAAQALSFGPAPSDILVANQQREAPLPIRHGSELERDPLTDVNSLGRSALTKTKP